MGIVYLVTIAVVFVGLDLLRINHPQVQGGRVC
jgi:hypothetical protein